MRCTEFSGGVREIRITMQTCAAATPESEFLKGAAGIFVRDLFQRLTGLARCGQITVASFKLEPGLNRNAIEQNKQGDEIFLKFAGINEFEFEYRLQRSDQNYE